MKKKIIVIGATGSTGIYVIDYLCEKLGEQYEIVAVGTRNTKYFDRFGVKYYSVDISNKDTLTSLPADNVYGIVILAGYLPARANADEPEKYIDINTKGILNIMEYYKDCGIDRVIYTVSIADLYGYLPEHPELTSDLPIKYNYMSDHMVYAISKTAAAEIIKTYYYTHGIKYYLFRLPNVYLYSPEKEYYKGFEKKIVAYRYMIDKAIKGEDIELWGDPNKSRDILYVKDFSQFIYRALVAENAECGYYNMGSDTVVTMQEQVEGIIKVFCSEDKKSNIIYRPEKPSFDSRHMNIDKTKKNLGYKEEYDYIAYLEDYKKEMNSDRYEGMY